MMNRLTFEIVHMPSSKGYSLKNRTPDTKRLCRGPAAFGLTPDPEESPADPKDTYYFIGICVAKSDGIMRITKTLRENKG